MKKMKSQNLLAVLTLMMMVSACGKNMSLQVAGSASSGAKNDVSTTIDTTKSAGSEAAKVASDDLKTNEDLQAFSEFDETDTTAVVKEEASDSDLKRRTTVQLAPKESITEVLSMDLVLRNPMLKVNSKTEVCLILEDKNILENKSGMDCQEISIADANETKVDLLEVFGLKAKTLSEQVDWIYSHSTSFADPGYRKFRMIIKGVSSVECGELTIQVSVNPKTMPENFATAPTSYKNGEADLRSSEETVVVSKPVVKAKKNSKHKAKHKAKRKHIAKK